MSGNARFTDCTGETLFKIKYQLTHEKKVRITNIQKNFNLYIITIKNKQDSAPKYYSINK